MLRDRSALRFEAPFVRHSVSSNFKGFFCTYVLYLCIFINIGRGRNRARMCLALQFLQVASRETRKYSSFQKISSRVFYGSYCPNKHPPAGRTCVCTRSTCPHSRAGLRRDGCVFGATDDSAPTLQSSLSCEGFIVCTLWMLRPRVTVF